MKNLSPKQKKVALAVAGAGILALIALLSRRSQPAAAPPVEGTFASPAGPGGSTFADNGEAMAGLSTVLTESLGEVALGLDATRQANEQTAGQLLSQSEQTSGQLMDAIRAMQESAARIPEVITVPAPAPAPAPAAPPAAVSHAGARPAAAPRAGTILQDRGTRAGLAYKPVTKGGKFYRFYESAAGRGDFGSRAQDKIYVRPAS